MSGIDSAIASLVAIEDILPIAAEATNFLHARLGLTNEESQEIFEGLFLNLQEFFGHPKYRMIQ